jgi:beta-glucanase (GH16 family)
MKRNLFLAGAGAALTAIGCAAPSKTSLLLPPSSVAGVRARSATKLVWSDEFDYSGHPDGSKWFFNVGGGGWGNDELEYYTHDRLENANVVSGLLNITARHESYKGSEYTSARLLSKRSWKYGRFEVRAKMPGGRGTWPAIWLYPLTSAYGQDPKSGEIDIVENVGYAPLMAYPTIHVEHYDAIKNPINGRKRIATIDSAFHTYALEWTASGMDIFYDDAQVLGYHPTASQLKDSRYWPYNREFFLILNVAVGGNWGGLHGVEAGAFPRTMQVDYVRVYQ